MAKRRTKKRLHGKEPSGLRPDWRPLLSFAPDEVPDFMWMFRDFLEDGTVVEAYKHTWTRQYLHLDASGRAYEFVGGRSYEEVDPQALLAKALRTCGSRANIVRQNEWVSGKKIAWASSATRHRIPRPRTLYVIQQAGVCFEDRAVRRGGPRLYFFGDDEDEQPLEIVTVEQEDGGLLVIHSMPMRERFEERYTEALRWRR
jgi:hypothetical protein